MDEQTFKRRTKRFALETLRLIDALPRNRSAETMGAQLFRQAAR